MSWDAVVVGSGFGGAAVAARLAESGASVLVLERGRRWDASNYPRTTTDPWIFQHTKPEKFNGWLDLRFFRGMVVVQGAGVGGGSMCYSSVVMEAEPELFDSGWPKEISYQELRPYYAKVREMLGVRDIPEGQRPQRWKLLAEAAEKLGYSDRFGNVPLALSFDPEYSYDLPDPLDARHSKRFVNAQGIEQGTCIHLGNCDIGCDVRAKNTLDLNYLPLAEQHGAEIRPLHVVTQVRPEGSGWVVRFDRIAGGKLVPGEERADRVVLAAGSLGTTEILLRNRDEHKTLPRVSRALGRRWSPNANFLTPAIYSDGDRVQQGIGPTISAGLDFMDGSQGGQRFYVEDDGFPNMLSNAVGARLRRGPFKPLGWLLRGHLGRGVDEKNPLRGFMVWLGEGLDAGDGELRLKRRKLKPWEKDIRLQWKLGQSGPVIDAIIAMHQRLTDVTGGRLRVPLYYRLLRGLVTVHPLGGATMASDGQRGVVDHAGRVFGHDRLYVADGSMLPGATGRNPSMTIAALGERVGALIAAE